MFIVSTIYLDYVIPYWHTPPTQIGAYPNLHVYSPSLCRSTRRCRSSWKSIGEIGEACDEEVTIQRFVLQPLTRTRACTEALQAGSIPETDALSIVERAISELEDDGNLNAGR